MRQKKGKKVIPLLPTRLRNTPTHSLSHTHMLSHKNTHTNTHTHTHTNTCWRQMAQGLGVMVSLTTEIVQVNELPSLDMSAQVSVCRACVCVCVRARARASARAVRARALVCVCVCVLHTVTQCFCHWLCMSNPYVFSIQVHVSHECLHIRHVCQLLKTRGAHSFSLSLDLSPAVLTYVCPAHSPPPAQKSTLSPALKTTCHFEGK